jgi:serine/threonine protein kinase
MQSHELEGRVSRLSLGQTVGGRYELIERISAGGMGQVFRGIDTQLFQRSVAIKILHQHLLGDPDLQKQLRRRFEEEARLSTLLGEHPLIIKILDYGIEEDQPYLVMEYLSGHGLGDLIVRDGSMAPHRVVHLGRQMCAGFFHAHSCKLDLGTHTIQGVIHRDIKPSNIYVLSDQTQQETVKILDFGIAKVISDVSVALGTETTGFLGTTRYASPEQLRGEELDARSDIYSLGVVLYRMLVGELPISPKTDSFAAWYQSHNYDQPQPFENYTSLPYEIPNALKDVIYSCLQKDRAKRPQTMQELSEALEASLGSSIPIRVTLPSVFSEHSILHLDEDSTLKAEQELEISSQHAHEGSHDGHSDTPNPHKQHQDHTLEARIVSENGHQVHSSSQNTTFLQPKASNPSPWPYTLIIFLGIGLAGIAAAGLGWRFLTNTHKSGSTTDLILPEPLFLDPSPIPLSSLSPTPLSSTPSPEGSSISTPVPNLAPSQATPESQSAPSSLSTPQSPVQSTPQPVVAPPQSTPKPATVSKPAVKSTPKPATPRQSTPKPVAPKPAVKSTPKPITKPTNRPTNRPSTPLFEPAPQQQRPQVAPKAPLRPTTDLKPKTGGTLEERRNQRDFE